MIDVQPYIEKLEVLKEYMAWKINHRNDINEMLEWFDLTGILFMNRGYSPKSFEDYYQYRTKNIWI